MQTINKDAANSGTAVVRTGGSADPLHLFHRLHCPQRTVRRSTLLQCSGHRCEVGCHCFLCSLYGIPPELFDDALPDDLDGTRRSEGEQ